MRPLLYTSPHLLNVRVHSHVSLFRRKFWASEVMYRGSAADFLALQGFYANSGIPPQKPQKDDYTHLVEFLRLTSIPGIEGCPLRRALQQGFGRSAEQNRGLGSISGSRAVHTCCCSYCCCSYCCMPGDLALADQAQLSKTYCHKRDINLSWRKVCSVYHVLRKCTRGDSAVYLHRAGPGAVGHRRCLKGYDRTSK